MVNAFVWNVAEMKLAAVFWLQLNEVWPNNATFLIFSAIRCSQSFLLDNILLRLCDFLHFNV